MPVTGDRTRYGIAAILAIATAGLLLPELAAANPFGVGQPEATVTIRSGPLAGVFGWIAVKQVEFYKGLSALVLAFRSEPAAAFGLIGLSFLYGLFHAAGPGHGKVVISSYLVATGETFRRGIALAFLSAFAQAMTAIALVSVLTIALNATSLVMTRATGMVEIASYVLIVLIGLRLVWAKGRSLFARPKPVVLQPAAAGVPSDLGSAAVHSHDHHHHHHHDHGACATCGHSHAPDPADLGGPFSLKRAWTAVLAVGLRPCTGAIIVLVFAFSQGVYGVGVAATLAMAVGTGLAVAILAGLAVGARGLAARLADGGSGWAMGGLRAIEFAAALAVLAFGILLLGGALQTQV